MADSKDWIVRYYASHDDIPEGKYDGHIVRELIRCKDCVNHEPEDYCHIRDGLWYDNDYCSSGERKTDPSDSPITCDYCKHWHGLKRDGRYWCSKYSAYMETGCEEGERKEE